MVEGINNGRVTEWFSQNIADAAPPLSFELIPGGRSNLTFRVIDSERKAFVLRRPPLGHILESAHDMGREYKIISSLGPTDIPVAPALGLCKDKSVNEADFYVMRYVEGKDLADIARTLGLSVSASEPNARGPQRRTAPRGRCGRVDCRAGSLASTTAVARWRASLRPRWPRATAASGGVMTVFGGCS